MNVLFLTLVEFESFNEHNIYTDLLRQFIGKGHTVCAISPSEKREGRATHMIREGGSSILRLQIGNIQKTNIIEKGISTILVEPTFKKAIRKYFADIRFDLVLYSTPPITLVGAIEYIKKRDGAKTYLLLKDIFPQNAVDIGMLSTTGPKRLLYRHFRNQEKKLYRISDRIGCMSRANAEYVKRNNPKINPDIVEVCPNSIEPVDKSVDRKTMETIRKKYDIPADKIVFLYGGNLGKPQGIPFLIESIRACKDIKDIFFLVIGSGTEYGLLEEYVNTAGQQNLKLVNRLPKDDYDHMVGACDVGLIFLDHRFTIPNFPSRLLSYLQAKIPVLACTDPNTDIGKVITEGGFGWWCESNDPERFRAKVMEALGADRKAMGINGFGVLNSEFNSETSYRIIIKSITAQQVTA